MEVYLNAPTTKTMMASSQHIETIIPQPTLQGLCDNIHDNDNDIDLLLDWLRPFYPTTNATPIEPSPRIKSAMRSCLKDDVSVHEFVKLYINSIARAFSQHWVYGDLSLKEHLQRIRQIHQYYSFYCRHLRLSGYPAELLSSSIDSNLREYILNTDFLMKFNIWTQSYFFEDIEMTPCGSVPEVISTLSESSLKQVVYSTIITDAMSKIIGYVHRECRRQWSKQCLPQITEFVVHRLCPKISTVTLDGNYVDELMKIAHDQLVKLRIEEIFDIVYHHPGSIVALEELYMCLHIKPLHHDNATDVNMSTVAHLVNVSISSQAYQRNKLVEVFINRSRQMLLHSGRHTVSVILFYTRTIKAFLIIDPRGVLLDKVARPIRNYIKSRSDVINKLVHGMLDDSGSNDLKELAIEFRKGHSAFQNSHETDDMNWNPDPIDALPDFKKGKVADVIESLVSIFDSRNTFIDEFTACFSSRLLSNFESQIDDTIANLTLLKARFGRDSFSELDVMVRDIQESSRISRWISMDGFHGSVLSGHYWNNLESNVTFTLPSDLLKRFESYNAQYSAHRRGRKLKLIPHLGHVSVKLVFNNGISQKFDVTPLQATVIQAFNEDAEELSPSIVAQRCGMLEYNAAQALQFWVKMKVLRSLPNAMYVVNENYEQIESPEARVIFPFVQTILENIKVISFARLKPLLSLTVPRTDLDIGDMDDDRLRTVLRELVDFGRISMEGLTYKLSSS
ncbi:hypothetical protein DIURU_002836 [Diutina rugosa]|uniref:Anaphase-promoting complex subunit 2 n=1 Tax=Diutina rugosa TaxID=5481 RepID=A0A642UNE4_DIURU|nr:uncharacterized protein DIURU_002836 [Diutina rugosa]KAA8902382.1 hypothetical protein DIURU_002836 [Diutina rugosa]